MDKGSVQFVGKELGQHGSNIYFKEFSVSTNGEKKNYKLGDFYFVQKDPTQPICIAEFQLIWMNLKDGRKLAAVKLYFKPEDTKQGRLAEHGEDELMEADRHVPVYCEQMPSWECRIGATFGRSVYQGVPASSELIMRKRCSEMNSTCSCNTANEQKAHSTRPHVKVLSFPAYCRYRATMKLIQSEHNLPKKMMIARGAIEVECPKTRILFNRFKFQHDDIDSFALAENIRIPVFKGRPRKRRQSRTKGATETKKQRIEKENSNPEIIKKYENSDKEEPNEVEFESEMKNGSGKQTYRIVAPPAHCDPERNVIHVKIESKKTSADLCRVKEAENEEMKIVIKTNCDADDNLIAEKENMMCWNDGNVEDGSTESPQISDDEPMLESLEKDEKARSVKGQNYQNNPPSELVKNGKTGTVLDEAFFREMRNGMKASEEVDKEKMRKILVDACKDVENFKRDLFLFMKQKGTPIVYVPKIGYTRVDLPKLFSLVVSNGGYRQVTLNHKWKKVYDEMALATTITSAATCMRRHYEKLLLPYEKHLRMKHRQDALSNKTYSISAQASQPLVLTIKTIKSENVDESNVKATSFSAPNGNQNYENCDSKKMSSTLGFQPNKETAKEILDVALHPAVNQTASFGSKESSLSTMMGATLNTIALSPENCTGHPNITTVTGPVTFPHGKGEPSPGKCTSNQTDNLKATFTNTVNNKAIVDYPKFATVSCFASNRFVGSSSGDPAFSSSSFSSPPTGLLLPTKEEIRPSVIMRDQYPIACTEDSPEQNQSAPSVRKRRGRPPKNARPHFEVVNFDSSARDAVFVQPGSTSLSNNNIYIGSMEDHQLNGTPNNNQTTKPTATLGNSRMCPSEVERRYTKKGAVKMYEYVVTSDSSSSKMVKHQQGIIPSFSDSREVHPVSFTSRPALSQPQTEFVKGDIARQYSNITDLCQVGNFSAKGSAYYPRVETVMSFASKGCLPSTLTNDRNRFFCKGADSNRKADEPYTNWENDLKLRGVDDKPHLHSIQSNVNDSVERVIMNNKIEVKEEQDRKENRCSEPRSVIVGPPPLVPIDKQKDIKLPKKGEMEGLVTKMCNEDSHQKFDSQQIKTDEKAKDGVEQISLVSDIKAMKETFDVDSMIRPLNKTIDRSLADLRKAAVTQFDNAKFVNGMHDEFSTVDRPTDADRRLNMGTQDMREDQFKRVLKSADPNELRVEVDRANDLNYDLNYDICQKYKREELECRDANENDSSRRLLRIASLGDFEAYAQETAKQKYVASLKEHLDEKIRTVKVEHSNEGCTQRLSAHQKRSDFDTLESRGSKVGNYGCVHPSQQDVLFLSEKCLYNELPSQRSGYFDEHNSKTYSHGSHRLQRDKSQEKYTSHRDDYHHSSTHEEAHCHRKLYHSEDSRHHRDPHHFGDSYHRRNFVHHSHVPFNFYHDSYHREHPFPNGSSDSNAVYYEGHHVDHHTRKHLVSPFQAGSPHIDHSHHGVNSMFIGRMGSPVFDRKQIARVETSPPPSMRSGWYSAHPLPVLGKDGRSPVSNAMYWHQKVHH